MPDRIRQTDHAGLSRKAEVLREVQDYMDHHDGRLPSGRELGRRLGLKDDRVVRAAWDMLAEQGKLPPRPGPQSKAPAPPGSKGGPIGALLEDAVAKLHIFTERVGLANDKERLYGAAFWVHELEVIESIVTDARDLITGDALDKELDSILGPDDMEENHGHNQG